MAVRPMLSVQQVLLYWFACAGYKRWERKEEASGWCSLHALSSINLCALWFEWKQLQHKENVRVAESFFLLDFVFQISSKFNRLTRLSLRDGVLSGVWGGFWWTAGSLCIKQQDLHVRSLSFGRLLEWMILSECCSLWDPHVLILRPTWNAYSFPHVA